MVAPAKVFFNTHLSLSLNPTPQTLNPIFFVIALLNYKINGCTNKILFNTSLSLSLNPTPKTLIFSSSHSQMMKSMVASARSFSTHIPLSLSLNFFPDFFLGISDLKKICYIKNLPSKVINHVTFTSSSLHFCKTLNSKLHPKP